MWLRIDCDWAAEGLWDGRGRMVSLESVPLSAGLKDQLTAWQAHFDEQAQPWSPEDRYNWDRHQEIGIDIARAVKAELPDWTVVAFDRLIEADGSLGSRVPYPGESR